MASNRSMASSMRPERTKPERRVLKETRVGRGIWSRRERAWDRAPHRA